MRVRQGLESYLRRAIAAHVQMGVGRLTHVDKCVGVIEHGCKTPVNKFVVVSGTMNTTKFIYLGKFLFLRYSVLDALANFHCLTLNSSNKVKQGDCVLHMHAHMRTHINMCTHIHTNKDIHVP